MEENRNLWEGTFSSLQYSSFFVNGTINILLPINLNKQIITTAQLKYTGLYRFGSTNLIDIRSDGITGTSSQLSPLTFKGGMGLQTIEFKCDRIEPNMNIISGTYITVNPMDNGTFIFHRTDKTEMQISSSECTII